MKYVSVDFKGRASAVLEKDFEDAMLDVMESGGALLRFDGENVCEYTGREEGASWDKVS